MLGNKVTIFWYSTMIYSLFGGQRLSSTNDRIRTIVRSSGDDDYFCENYLWTCFFRQRYHQERVDYCKSLLILHSCLHYDTDVMHCCRLSTLIQVRVSLFNETRTYCFTSSIYRTFASQHLHSISSPRLILNYPLFLAVLLLIVLTTRIRTSS